MITEIHCLPRPTGTDEERYAYVHAAIAVIEASGLTFEVGALGTTVEGEPDEVWPLLRRVHDACLAAGADSVITVIKVAQWAVPEGAPSIASLTDRYRG
ncbi:MAG TPA: thiamine-binding protein [Acidimicrobiales bacterium]|nr:thiamine-binding protein [Acidimicrobiales bacterium]